MEGRDSRLELVCKELDNHAVDICIVMETKLSGYHTCNLYGYNITATRCSNKHQGGVAIVCRKISSWHIEGKRSYGQNVLKVTLVHGRKQATILGVYIPPTEVDLTMMKRMDEALDTVDLHNLMILGDFNTNLASPITQWDVELTDSIASYCVRNVAKMFMVKRRKWCSWTWQKY